MNSTIKYQKWNFEKWRTTNKKGLGILFWRQQFWHLTDLKQFWNKIVQERFLIEIGSILKCKMTKFIANDLIPFTITSQ